MSRLQTATLITVATLITAMPSASFSQPTGRGFWPDGPGMMMGPGMMHGWRRNDQRSFCNPGAAGFSEWQYDRIVKAVQPNDAQRKALEELRSASTKAAEKVAATCPAEFPVKAADRLSFMEKRMEGMLEAVRTVRPAFDAFYASLDEKQKANLDALNVRRGWHRWR